MEKRKENMETETSLIICSDDAKTKFKDVENFILSAINNPYKRKKNYH